MRASVIYYLSFCCQYIDVRWTRWSLLTWRTRKVMPDEVFTRVIASAAAVGVNDWQFGRASVIKWCHQHITISSQHSGSAFRYKKRDPAWNRQLCAMIILLLERNEVAEIFVSENREMEVFSDENRLTATQPQRRKIISQIKTHENIEQKPN